MITRRSIFGFALTAPAAAVAIPLAKMLPEIGRPSGMTPPQFFRWWSSTGLRASDWRDFNDWAAIKHNIDLIYREKNGD